MNIAFLSPSLNWSTFNNLLGLGTPAITAKPEDSSNLRLTTSAAPASRALSNKTLATGGNRPLRVVRLMEVGQAPSQVGRMVISGRMADVCAELDRLVAREAAMH